MVTSRHDSVAASSCDDDHEAIDEFVGLVAQQVADARRVAAVAETGLLDTPADDTFDRIASLASRLLDTPFGFVTIVDEARSYWKACIGVDATAPTDRQNAVHESFCQYVIGTGAAFMIDDTRVDPRTASNPSIESMGVLAWAGVPMRNRAGDVLGTVCVVDQRTRSWTDDDARLLGDLAEIATDAIDVAATARRAARSEALLAEVLARAPIGFALVDHELRYEMINDTLADINGVAVTDHVGRTIGEVLPDVAPQVEPIIRSVAEIGEPVVGVEVSGSTPAAPGIERTWSANYYCLEIDDAPHVGLFVEEITERVRARRRARLLADLTEALSTVETGEDLSAVVAHQVRDYFDAAVAHVELCEPVDVRIGTPVSNRRDAAVPLADRGRSQSVARQTGEVVTVCDDAERATRFRPSAPADGAVAAVAVPCVSVEDRVVAVVTIEWPRPVEPDDVPHPQLRTVARLIAGVVERSETDRERQHMLRSLHASLLTSQPDRAGLRTAVRYRPASRAIGFGGDWYDIVPIDELRTALVVGDVEGHGPVAAARMSQLSSIVAQLLLADHPLDDVFAAAERICEARSIEVMSTVGIVAVDSEQRRVTALSAGHLPGIAVPPGGAARLMSPALRPPLQGWGTAVRPTPQPYVPGTRLVLFTDGMVETRGRDIVTDLGDAVAAVDRIGPVPPAELADRLLTEHAVTRDDDVAVIVADLD